MQQKPKTAAEYQAEMMQLYRRAHPAQETITESQSITDVTDTITTPTTETNAFPSAPDLPPIPTSSSVPESPVMSPENLPPESTAPTEAPTSEPLSSDIVTPPEPESPTTSSDNAATTEPPPVSPIPTELLSSILPEEKTPVVELEPVPKIAPNTAYGFLKVITRTGSEALPLPNVTVTVSAMEEGNSRLYFSGMTNESGETDHIPLPAPELNPNASSTDRQLYQSYDVTVYHPDYFRMESRGLPIFPGITSLQKFAMIPLPKRPGENPPTVVYENTEPRFPD
ncbi:MAG: hypothetical protein Q4D37_02220 [Oscillospiraceae bacterium]|nr:hypothetical protein [Oscillospiraceae bacterium]